MRKITQQHTQQKYPVVATEVFKLKNGLSLPFINKILLRNAQHYDLKLNQIKLNLREVLLKQSTAELKR